MTTPDRLTAALADRYKIERELGAGGMATVYLAQDLKHRRRVAIKVLRPELAQVLGAERFLREIEVVAGLHHPHILPLYDSGEAAGFLYYVMPLVEGESLRAKIDREGQLPIEEALRYAREVADALSYAHARGVVHRDIKPDNIMIESEHAVVADFGIAKAVASAGDATALTGTGMSVGTPAYMSPEQAAGDREVDGRSDLYSLGCVLFEMLAGQPPFTGKTIEILVRQHIMTPPPPVTQFRPAVPAPVADALARALAKAPADRFNPVGQFSSALGISASSSTTVAPAAIHPEVKRARRTGLVVGGAFAVLLLLAAGFIFMRRSNGGPESSSLRTIAVLPFRNIGADTSTEAFVQGMHGEMVTQLTGLGSMQVASQSSAGQYRESSKPNRDIAAELGVEHLLTGSVQRSGTQVRVIVALEDAARNRQLWAQSYERALTPENLFAIQADIAREVTSALSIQLTSDQEAAISRPLTRNLAALDLYYRAQALWAGRDPTNDTTTVQLLEEAVRLDSSFARAWSMLAHTRSWLLRTGRHVDTMPAWTAVLRTTALDPRSLEAALASAYYRYYARADYRGALASLEEADRLMPNSAEILSAQGLLLRRLGRWDEGVQVQRRAIQLDRRNPFVLDNLAETYFFLRRWDDGEPLLDLALTITPASANLIFSKVQLLRDGRGDTAGVRSVVENSRSLISPAAASVILGRLHMLSRDLPAALDAVRQWPDAGSYTAYSGSRKLNLALLTDALKDPVARAAYLDSVIITGNQDLTVRRRRGPDDPFGTQAIVELHIAVAYAMAGDSARAVSLAETATRRFSPERDQIDAIEHRRWLAAVYMFAGRKADAIATLKGMLAVPSTMTVNDLRLNFVWDRLREEPAFHQLTSGS